MEKVLLMTLLLSQSIQCFCQNYFAQGTECLKDAKIEKDVFEIAGKIPQYKPAKIGNEPVYYKGILTLEF